ncbi:MAG: LytTR family transcriptional regulator [Clostridia bacterium]|nr:LytTR family transcriptional regulator [Clostridia bacterium]
MSHLITIRWRNKRKIINAEKIVYVESYNRHLIICTETEKCEIVGKLGDFICLLPEGMFLSIHKSFAVNMKYISELSAEGAVMIDGTVLPVSVRRKTRALETFDRFCKERGDEQCIF